MGVDFYTCANCDSTFPDCGEYFSCDTCGHYFCSDICGGKKYKNENEDNENEDNEDEDGDDDYEEEESTCILCRKESATDNQLLNFLLLKFSLTYEEALRQYQKHTESTEPTD